MVFIEIPYILLICIWKDGNKEPKQIPLTARLLRFFSVYLMVLHWDHFFLIFTSETSF